MQGSKLPGKPSGARLWIAGVSTALILAGCEGQPANQQIANSNQPSAHEEKAKTEDEKKVVAQGAATPQATVAPAEVDQYSQSAPAAAPAPGAELGAGAFRQRGDTL